MALRYRVTKRSNNIGTKKEQYILQVVNTGTINLDTYLRMVKL